MPAARHVIALDGTPGRWLPAGFDVVRQRGRGLDERIAAAMGEAYARLPVPVILIGMDTPQVTPELLASAIRPLVRGTADAVFGQADDGGFWLLGLRQPDPAPGDRRAHVGGAIPAQFSSPGSTAPGCECTGCDVAPTWTTRPMPPPSPARYRRAASPRRCGKCCRRDWPGFDSHWGTPSRAAPADASTDGRAALPVALTWPVSSQRLPLGCLRSGPYGIVTCWRAAARVASGRGWLDIMAGKRGPWRRSAHLREKLAAGSLAVLRRVSAALRKAVAALLVVVTALRGKVAALADSDGRLRRTLSRPPPGPFRPGTWRSPLRGQWLTSLLGLVLLVGLTILAVTGLLSYAAYNPRLPGNDETSGAPLLKFYLFSWPTHPSWLYRVDQGIHITLGLALVPFVLAKLWSVLPKLFTWPPVRSAAQSLERLSLIMIVGGVLFEFATGILDIQNYYVFPFSFYTAHLYGAWVFIAGLVTHVTLKFPHMLAGLQSRSLRRELRTPLSGTLPEVPDPAGLRALPPQRRLSRGAGC